MRQSDELCLHGGQKVWVQCSARAQKWAWLRLLLDVGLEGNTWLMELCVVSAPGQLWKKAGLL